MPHRKITKKISEIGKYFERDEESAMHTMYKTLRLLRLTDSKLGLKTHGNAKTKSAMKLMVLILMPFFEVKRVCHYEGSWLYRLAESGRDVYYRMLKSVKVNWRTVYARFSGTVLGMMGEGCGKGDLPRCLIADDTDFPKRGSTMELIGRVFSHTLHSHILAYKCLTLGWSDGSTFLPLDFSLHGELGKNKDQGISAKQRNARHETRRDKGDAASKRFDEYFASKVDTLIGMVKRAAKRGVEFEYLLTDSWFSCDKLIKAMTSLPGTHHFLGMMKNGKELFSVKGVQMRAADIIKANCRSKINCGRFHCKYFSVKAEYKGTPVKLFFCQRRASDGWKIILTTDTRLGFIRAYEIYSMRWSIEVYFKEAKQFLMLGKNQSVSFPAQIAATTVTMMQYSLLALAKRESDYRTLGGLFRGTIADSIELTVYERILSVLINLLEEFLGFIGFPNKSVVEKFLSQDELIARAIKRTRPKQCA